jgi:putative membrane-bound dehydrogenase-like protein
MSPIPVVSSPFRILVCSLAGVLSALSGAGAEPEAKPLFASGVITPATKGHAVAIDVELPVQAKDLWLVVTDGKDGFGFDWADWAEPRFVKSDGSEIKLTSLEWKEAKTGWGEARVNANAEGTPLSIDGKPVSYGIGVHANAMIHYAIPDGATRFKALAGLDTGGSAQGGGSVVFALFTANPATWLVKNSGGSGGGGESAGHDPAQAVAGLDVHEGLEATLFASEPMMVSPSSIDVDHRGRVWICEVVNYRGHRNDRPEGDRILIVEDTDGDNVADKSTVFYQGRDVDSAHGICIMGNKALVSAGEDVFYLIDDNGDDKADRKELLFTQTGGAQHDHNTHAFHFGPDGKLYFNFGNASNKLRDKEGKPITDLAGNVVEVNGKPYRQGMIFRCNPDGSQVESLAWNFRNNWEVAVDSFGGLWQSDNDDDGNKGVRINYVLNFGNYGYTDEKTGSGWNQPRVGMEEEIPLRHWHLNDPGVVPNLLQTGAGSPAGICFYEGQLLPPLFHGQPIHCDPGPNVTRAYVSKPDGAGYKAEPVDILLGTRDRWFRPSDVCVTPDGALMVADWYDPGVGGHGMGDRGRGRLFLVTPPGHKYQAPIVDVSTRDGAVKALGSPNEATRYLAHVALTKMATDNKAERDALTALARDTVTSRLTSARLWWIVAAIDPDGCLTPPAKSDEAASPASLFTHADPSFRKIAIRAARQAFREKADKLRAVVGAFVNDPDASVRREAAIALRFDPSPEASTLWAGLANSGLAKDRWGLEALGIGADLAWDARMAAWLTDPVPADYAPILWRSRGAQTATLVAEGLAKGELGKEGDALTPERWLRSFHFLDDSEAKSAALLGIFDKGEARLAGLTALHYLKPEQIGDDRKNRLKEVVAAMPKDSSFVSTIAKFGLPGFSVDLAKFIEANPQSPEGVLAATALLGDQEMLLKELASTEPSPARSNLAKTLARTQKPEAYTFMETLFQNQAAAGETKRAGVEGLAQTKGGAEFLLQQAEAGKLAESIKVTASLLLSRHPDAGVRDKAAKVLPPPVAVGMEKLPPAAELLAMKGNSLKGKEAFVKATCATCHKVGGEGLEFGPDLSQIGAKLPAEALLEAVLYPSNAIAHSFHGTKLTLKNGSNIAGIIASEDATTLVLRQPAGIVQNIPTGDVTQREDIKESLMPPGLATILTPVEIADLLAYMASLR